MIEEFAVSLFAQHLGTAQPISPKKLDQAFAEVTSTIQPFGAQRHLIGTADLTNTSPSSQQKPKPQAPASTPPDRPTQAALNSLKSHLGKR